MNRRHFLKFIPLIPIAIGLVKLPVSAAKPAANTLASIDEMMERIRVINGLNEIKERFGLDQLDQMKVEIEEAIKLKESSAILSFRQG